MSKTAATSRLLDKVHFNQRVRRNYEKLVNRVLSAIWRGLAVLHWLLWLAKHAMESRFFSDRP